MPQTPNHGYNLPDEGATDWHNPLNENFEQYDTDIEIRDLTHNMTDYDPKDGAKFLATDTGNVFVGDGDQWNPLNTSVDSGPAILPPSIPETTVHGFVEIKDSEGNPIEGGARFEPALGMAEVLRFDHTKEIRTKPKTGKLRGVAQHRPLTFVKPYDKASPLLYEALCNGETLREVIIHWYENDESGERVEFFTHTLEGAEISKIRSFGSMPQEAVTLLYSKITWSFPEGNIEFSDSWTAER